MKRRFSSFVSKAMFLDGAIALFPVLLAAFGLGTPWPDLWQGAALAVFVNICLLAVLRSRAAELRSSRSTAIALASLSAISLIAFFVFSNQWVEYYRTPRAARPEPIVVGFEVRKNWSDYVQAREQKWASGTMPDWEKEMLPRQPSRIDLLMAEAFQPDKVWTLRSLLFVRLGLLVNWVLFIGGVVALYRLYRPAAEPLPSLDRVDDMDLLSNDEMLELAQFCVNHDLPAKRGVLLQKHVHLLPEFDTPADQVYSDIINLASSKYAQPGSEHPFVTWIKTAIRLVSTQPKAVAFLQRYDALVNARLSDIEGRVPSDPNTERPSHEPS